MTITYEPGSSGGSGSSESVNTVASSGTALALDTDYDIHDITVDAACTITFANVPTVRTQVLRFSGDGVGTNTVTLPGGGTIGVASTTSDLTVTGITVDGGTNWDFYRNGSPSLAASSEGGGLLAVATHNPGTQTTYTATSTMAAVDSTNLKATATAPDSGAVEVEIEAVCIVAGVSPRLYLGVLVDGVQQGGDHWVLYGPSSVIDNAEFRKVCRIRLTGLNPGQSYQFSLAAKKDGSGSGWVTYGALRGPAKIKVHRA